MPLALRIKLIGYALVCVPKTQQHVLT